MFVVETVRWRKHSRVVVVEESSKRELEEGVVSDIGVDGRVAVRRRTALGRERDRFGHVEVGRVGCVRHGRYVWRRTSANVVERHAVEVGVPLELVGTTTSEALTLVAE